MCVRMWSNWKSHILLVEYKVVIYIILHFTFSSVTRTIMENGLSVSYKIKHAFIVHPSNCTCRHLSPIL